MTVQPAIVEQWSDWQPRTRASAVGELARFVRLSTRPVEVVPPELERYLTVALRSDFPPQDGNDVFEGLLAEHCLKLKELTPLILADIDRQLGLNLNGSPAAATTARRYRSQARSVIQRAVDLELLERNPWPARKKGQARRKNRKKAKIDIRQLPNHRTMQLALASILNLRPESRTYHAMTSVAYYAGMRPSEIVMLRPRALTLPPAGWGLIAITEADIDFEEPGEPKTGERTVPIPPVLVETLSDWLEQVDFAADEPIFRTRNGNRPTSSNWLRSWHRALAKIDHRPLRIYDCRHTAATVWIAAGVPLGEVARRLGHSVEVLVQTYLGALEEDVAIANQRIDSYFNS